MSEFVHMQSNRSRFNINRLVGITLIFTVMLTVIQQIFLSSQYYQVIRTVEYFIFGFLTTISLMKFNFMVKSSFYRVFFVSFIINVLILLILSFLKGRIIVFDSIHLVIPLFFISCGIYSEFHQGELDRFLDVYSILCILLGIYTIFTYGSGFTITSQYFFASKNQIGVMLSTSAIIQFISLIKPSDCSIKYFKHRKYLNVITFLLLVLVLAALRSRASLLSMVVVIMTASFTNEFRKKTKKQLIALITTSVLFIFVLYIAYTIGFLKYFWSSLTMNYNIYDMNSLTAGRVDLIKYALEKIGANLFLGIEENSAIVPHNYLLNKLLNFGLFGSLAMITLYAYLWIASMKDIIHHKLNSDISTWLLLFALLMSLSEYSAPYGPGVSLVVIWLLVGVRIKRNLQLKY